MLDANTGKTQENAKTLRGASGLVLVENVVEQCFWGAVLKGLVKKMAKSVQFLRGNGVILGGEGWCAH